MEIFWHSLLHALEDTAFTIPVLYLAYLLVSYFSHNNNQRYSKILHHTNQAGPVVGAFFGCIPQCGFSSVMSDLYSKKIVSIGTLFAVFIATSDEAIPLMIARPEFIPDLLLLVAIKFVYAVFVGYLIDEFVRLVSRKKIKLNDYHDKFDLKNEQIKGENSKNCQCVEENKNIENVEKCLDDDHHCECDCCDCHDENEKKSHKSNHHHEGHNHCCATNIFLDALKHTAIIVAYVFIATLIINLIEGYAGGLDPLKSIFTENVYIQILFAGLIGLIPNCAASVLLVELFMEGVLFFPALVGGLCAGAGVGLIILFTRNYKKVWQNIAITASLYIFAVAGGLLISLFF